MKLVNIVDAIAELCIIAALGMMILTLVGVRPEPLVIAGAAAGAVVGRVIISRGKR